jgi:uncharacterized protein YggU (UPF0235/DUF167 family)
MRKLDQVIRDVCPLIVEQICEQRKELTAPAIEERLKGLIDLLEAIFTLAKGKIDFKDGSTSDNRFEAVTVSDEEYEQIMERLKELSR